MTLAALTAWAFAARATALAALRRTFCVIRGRLLHNRCIFQLNRVFDEALGLLGLAGAFARTARTAVVRAALRTRISALAIGAYGFRLFRALWLGSCALWDIALRALFGALLVAFRALAAGTIIAPASTSATRALTAAALVGALLVIGSRLGLGLRRRSGLVTFAEEHIDEFGK